MPTLAVQLKIGDYAKWRPVFDKHKTLRDKAGFTNTQIYRHADTAGELLIWSDVADVAQARQALAGQESEAQCKKRVWWGPQNSCHCLADAELVFY